MARKKPFRRKNRQVKMTLSIPDEYKDEESFMQDFMDKMDRTGWDLSLDDADGETCIEVPVSAIQLGDIEIGPDEEED